jgi:hypothetical protein
MFWPQAPFSQSKSGRCLGTSPAEGPQGNEKPIQRDEDTTATGCVLDPGEDLD